MSDTSLEAQYSDAPRRLAVAYARFVDDREFSRLAEILTEDVQISSEHFSCEGLPAFMEQMQLINNYKATHHMIGNQFGGWSEGVYTGETYCIANHLYDVDGVDWKWEMGLRYQDRIVVRDGQALFTHRYLNVVWQADHPLMALGARHAPPAA